MLNPIAGALPTIALPCLSIRIVVSLVTLPSALLHLGNRADRREQGLVERRRIAAAAVGEVERRPAGDHRVRALTGLVEDRVERLVDRVREDVGAAHHRDPEHDRDRGQDRAQLAAEQTLQGELDHAVVIASSAARISGCVERGSSLTILPSARKSTRSAMAAARGSCVTITVVWPYSSTECLSRSRISLPVFESRLPVGSSAKTTVGRETSARAIATRCCCPPDSSEGRCLRRSARPTLFSSVLEELRIGLLAGDRERQQDVLLGREHRQQVEELEDEADVLAAELRQVGVAQSV